MKAEELIQFLKATIIYIKESVRKWDSPKFQIGINLWEF